MYDHGCFAEILQMAPTGFSIQDAGDATAAVHIAPVALCSDARDDSKKRWAVSQKSPVVICWSMTKDTMSFH